MPKSLQNLVELSSSNTPRRRKIGGAGHPHRSLIHAARQQVGKSVKLFRRPGREVTSYCGLLEAHSKKSHAENGVDCSPCLPSHNGRCIEQCDLLEIAFGARIEERMRSRKERTPRITRSLRRSSDFGRNFSMYQFMHSGEQTELPAEMMVQRAASKLRFSDELFGCDLFVAAFCELSPANRNQSRTSG